MTDSPLDAEDLAPTPTGGLKPLVVDADGVMDWTNIPLSALPDLNIVFTGYNATGSSIPAGAAVYVTNVTGGVPRIALADYSAAATMPAYGLTVSAIANGASGSVLVHGMLLNVDTSAFAVADLLHVGAAGALSASAPGFSFVDQIVGIVLTAHATTGSVFVSQDLAIDGISTYTMNGTWTIGPSNAAGTRRLDFVNSSGTTHLDATLAGPTKTLTLPNATDTLVGRDTTDTLTNKTLTTPTIGSFVNATHTHQNAAGGGTLDHGLALTGLSDDDHAQYVLLAGRSPSQVIFGGTDTTESLTLKSNSSGLTKGTITLFDPVLLTDQAASPTVTGRFQRNGTIIQFYDGTATRTLATRDLAETLSSKTLTTPTIGDFTNANHTHLNAAGGGTLTLAALATQASQTLVGRGDAGTGVVSALTFSDTGIAVSTGEVFSVSGRLIGKQFLSSGTTYTPTTGTNTVVLVMQGAGGGGGGAARTAANSAGAAGGGSGGWLSKRFTGVTGTYTYAIGAGGGGGAAGNNTGTTGGDTTFTNGATVYTTKGGVGGTGSAAGTAVSFVTGGSGGAVSTNGDINSGGSPGAYGLTLSGTVAAAGLGGSCPFGGGGLAATTERAGFTGTGFGSGGGGGVCLGTTARAGGDGKGGLIEVWEFT